MTASSILHHLHVAAVHAQTTPTPPTQPTNTVREPIFKNVTAVVTKACEVLDILFTGALLLTIVFVLLAAMRYITKGADPGEVSKAHQMLIWAAIGFAVALLATVIPYFVAGALGTSVGQAC